ncbi:amidohydrolase family protein [Halanaeroarchaeum sulfurireducens]|uniref:Nucleoside deaminase (Cytosine deaminase, guanine deaminase) n=1 Tax=Halanaeroarchaeum sulfurireducens TaxID=1604004 RepID=A0A0N9NAZ8_9EURY|nr:amidohydrolase family protein [Halanaeroarchaeum sulfurireducens]ALG82564.1 nucleoside deaminase (cytosine deaminase, guanine deaminase) [Halanaeroarchaeum sulfurireducens]
MELSGTILRGPDFDPIAGRVVIEEGTIVAVEESAADASDDIVLPAFVNAHTHVGDSLAKGAGRGLDLDELVAPPDGLKHRLLREADEAETIEAMRRSLRYMQRGGTGAFLDFREGGVAGVEALREAATGLDIEVVAFGRGEPAVLEVAEGFGASGARDDDFDALRAAARDAGKPFGIHAGERDAEDVDPALDLDPDHLVHMVHAEADHLDRVSETATPIVACPRSNLVTGVGLPPLRDIVDHTTVALGTDNVMLNGPSMFREMAFAAKCCDVTDETVLRMATRNGARVAGLDGSVIEGGAPARLLVLDGDSDNLAGAQDPVRAVVRRAGVNDVKRVVLPSGDAGVDGA